MRLFFILFFITLTTVVFAQQPFQGTIVYRIKVDREQEEVGLTALFGINKLRLTFRAQGVLKKESIVVDLDSGKIIVINADNKTYLAQSLKNAPPALTAPTQKTIAGYLTTPYLSDDRPGLGGFSAAVFGQGIFHAANDLYFPVPKKYFKGPELMIIQNDRIVLGAEFKTSPGLYDDDPQNDSVSTTVFFAEAIKVERGAVEKSSFEIPSDYSPYEFKADTTQIHAADSVWMPADSTLSVGAPAAEKPSGQKKLPQKKPASKKGEATGPKKPNS
jgi:hypothetical protein